MPFDVQDFQLPTETETKLEPWRQVLLDAAKYIREHGWCQHDSYCNKIGEVCAIGAISMVTNIPASLIHNQHTFSPFLGPLVRYIGDRDVAAWNDEPGRTAEEVAATMEAVALRDAR